MRPLPERACVVKGGLCEFCRLGAVLFLACLRRICAAHQDGLLAQRSAFFWLFAPLLFATNVLRLVPVLRSSLRGLFGRSFLHATVPLPVPSWTPADRKVRPRSGAFRPTPIKSVRSSCETPLRSTISFTPGRDDQVKGTHRAGKEPQGSARREGGGSTLSQKSKSFSVSLISRCYTSGA
jgi:hypothetical protein